MKKVVLAYSGGLDTTYCLLYLSKIKHMEVHAVTVDTGGFSKEEIKDIEKRAMELGAASYECVDAVDQYYESCIRYLVFGNILKNNTYPLSVSAERISQAMSIAAYAKKISADAVAHGSTGAGNDQVRFDMIFQILLPGAEIITPIRDLQLSREAEIEFLKSHGVEMNFEKAKYSINKGIWGTSVGGKETLTSGQPLPDAAFPTPVSKEQPEDLTLHFEKGELKGVNEEKFEKPAEAIRRLSAIAAPFGIGRDIHVGDTIIGIKGRVGFEAAAPVLIIKAHHTLEKHVLTKWQLYWKDQLAMWYGNWLHEGQLLDPTMRNIEKFLEDTQQNVTGKVFLTLHPHRFTVNGIESAHDLMSARFGSYGEMNKGWTAEDVKGFTKIFGNQTAIYYNVNEEN
ncbi:argininosuccinate synthase [Anseongella ginsenosidimutans]|uniref:argininosuccinate synthase n=1 Tax=Anseongella ginsenosidimutans TaxID=496056 RepID=A0A4R3KUL7_9SPHI|nr:argininosuccinate synthase domain-containing protein [Anseongella ginsenosidimutans]QEC51755.1 argininosuccinate synthase [Anseongella ginsenosidimutans]TCS89119.1 argininosuccinate synthase [Anseongella ginsenosidimutans]